MPHEPRVPPYLATILKPLQDTFMVSIRRHDAPTTLTRPRVFVTNVQPPRKWRITKPPNTVLISGIPLCLAYGENSLTSKLAQAAKKTCPLLAPCLLSLPSSLAYGEKDEEDVFNDPLPALASNTHSTPPILPISTLITCINPPATKPLVQIKSAVVLNTTAVPRLEIC